MTEGRLNFILSILKWKIEMRVYTLHTYFLNTLDSFSQNQCPYFITNSICSITSY